MTVEKFKKIPMNVWYNLIAKINLNTILLALISGWVTVNTFSANTKQTVMEQKQDTAQAKTATWQAKRDSMQKILVAKLDTSLDNQKKIMKKLNIK